MYLLDTVTVSELRKLSAGKADPGLAAWADGVGGVELFVSVVSVHELEHGVLLAERADPPRGAVLRRWLDDGVLQAFRDRVIVVDTSVARRAAGYHVPDPAPFRDALIAATAVEHDMTVVTRNVRDFERFGVRLHNPWN